MSKASEFLLDSQPRARWMRLDTAQLLKRFFFCERALIVSQAAWIPIFAPLEIKTGIARFLWQCAETANALRERVFELRFPSRLLEEEGADRSLIELFCCLKDAPSVPAFLLGMARVLLPALRDAYQAISQHRMRLPTARRIAFSRWRFQKSPHRSQPSRDGPKPSFHSSPSSARKRKGGLHNLKKD